MQTSKRGIIYLTYRRNQMFSKYICRKCFLFKVSKKYMNNAAYNRSSEQWISNVWMKDKKNERYKEYKFTWSILLFSKVIHWYRFYMLRDIHNNRSLLFHPLLILQHPSLHPINFPISLRISFLYLFYFLHFFFSLSPFFPF